MARFLDHSIKGGGQLPPIAVSPTPTPTPTPTPGTVTIDPLVAKSGNVYTFTARRTGDVSAASNATITVSGSTSYPPAATAADFGGSFPTATAAFAAGAATTSFQVTSAVAQPE